MRYNKALFEFEEEAKMLPIQMCIGIILLYNKKTKKEY